MRTGPRWQQSAVRRRVSQWPREGVQADTYADEDADEGDEDLQERSARCQEPCARNAPCFRRRCCR